MGVGHVETILTWSEYKTEIYQYCYITGTAHDAVLARFLTAAARHADEYLRNPFTEEQVLITLASVAVGNSLTIDGALFTAATATNEKEREFKCGVSDAEDAVALLALINSTTIGGSHGAVGVSTVVGTNEAGVITLKHRYPNEGDIAVTSTDDDRLLVALTRVQLDIPADVYVWCCQFVAWKFGNRDGRKSERSEMGISSVDWGDGPDESLLDLYVKNVLEVI